MPYKFNEPEDQAKIAAVEIPYFYCYLNSKSATIALQRIDENGQPVGTPVEQQENLVDDAGNMRITAEEYAVVKGMMYRLLAESGKIKQGQVI